MTDKHVKETSLQMSYTDPKIGGTLLRSLVGPSLVTPSVRVLVPDVRRTYRPSASSQTGPARPDHHYRREVPIVVTPTGSVAGTSLPTPSLTLQDRVEVTVSDPGPVFRCEPDGVTQAYVGKLPMR